MKHLLKISIIILFPLILGKVMNPISNPENEEMTVMPYPEHIAGAYTGGFGEESCHSCHFDYEPNQPEGELLVGGIGESYEPGREYQIRITVRREDMQRGGFQMTARFENGTQAGSFRLKENLTTTPDIDNEVIYVQHGVGKVEASNSVKTWQVTWLAPEQRDPVVLNIAANAANGDASEFGDWIYVKEIRINK